MLLRVFKSNQPLIRVLFPISIAVLWLIPFFLDLKAPEDPFASSILLKSLHPIQTEYSLLLGGLAVLIQAFLLNSLFNAADLLSRDSHLPGAFLILLEAYDPSNFFLNSHHFLFIFVLISLRLLILIRRDQPCIEQTFLFGLLLSFAGLFNFNAFLLLPMAWLFLILIRPFKWREFIAPFVGAAITIAFLSAWWYFYNSGASILDYFPEQVGDAVFYSGNREITLALAVAFGFSFFFSIIRWLAISGKSTMRFKKVSRAVMLSAIYYGGGSAVLLYFDFSEAPLHGLILLLAIPLTLYFQEDRRNIWKALVFHAMIGLVVANHLV